MDGYYCSDPGDGLLPTLCTSTCSDNIKVSTEQWDDNNTIDGDG